MAFPGVIELNVGGKPMTTLLSTLTKEPDSMLAAMFSELHVSKDKDGGYFIDCDGEVFHFIIEFLRNGTVPPSEMALKVYDLASHFGIKSLVEKIESCNTVQYRKRIEELRTSFDARQYEQLKHEVIKMMYNGNASPQENKVLRLIEMTNSTCSYVPTYFQSELKLSCQGYLLNIKDCVLSFTDISVVTDCRITEEIKRCLAYDLCNLGYGKYSRTNIHERSVPNECYKCGLQHRLKGHLIMLLTHNFKTI